jgi:hypothetical protein
MREAFLPVKIKYVDRRLTDHPAFQRHDINEGFPIEEILGWFEQSDMTAGRTVEERLNAILQQIKSVGGRDLIVTQLVREVREADLHYLEGL